MNKNKNVLKGIILISQIGITMIVPIFLCFFVGKKLDDWFGTEYITLIGILLGIMVAFRNVYVLTRQFYAKDKAKEDAELKIVADMKREREKALKEAKK